VQASPYFDKLSTSFATLQPYLKEPTMYDYDLDLDLDQELSEIPAEYQDAFRQALEQELADTEQNRTDTDILGYLRQRRDDFKRGSFIRPDGRPGLVTLNPEAMYEQALPQLAQNSLGADDEAQERRRTLIKLGIFALVILLLLFLALRGRAQRADKEEAAAAEKSVAALAAGPGIGEPGTGDGGAGLPASAEPTPPLPELGGADDSLQTIGSLGGALTIGRPSAIELHYGHATSGEPTGDAPVAAGSSHSPPGETIALAIDPSRPTPKGELRFNEATMRSDNPVAVWLFGTVLNYAIGIPDSMVRNLQPGDRITLSTDTGARLSFVVAETGQAASYDAGRLLSQNRLGLTLFALPAAAETDVAYALANYDISDEMGQGPAVYGVGEVVVLPVGGELQVTAVQFDHTADGGLGVVISGTTNLTAGQTLMLSLVAGSEQTTAVPLTLTNDGGWRVDHTLPGGPSQPSHSRLLAEFRTLPGGDLVVVDLGEAPRLSDDLAIEIESAYWDEDQARVQLTLTITNAGAGAVYLGPDFIQLIPEGGDAHGPTAQAAPRLPEQVLPRLPFLIHPGATTGLTVSLPPQSTSMRLQIGVDIWELGH
jgi:hypothetical protein